MSKPKIQAVAFDMDGLMFNSEDVYFETGLRLLRLFDCEYTHTLSKTLMGCTPQDAFQGMIDAHDLPTTWQELQAKSDEIFLSIMPDLLQPMPGLFRLLDHLDAQGIPHAVCTSSNPELVYKMLPIHDLERRFDFILTSADVTHGKPHPEMYLRAAERFGVKPESMMVLEDSYNGCLAGANAGAFVVAVPGEHSQDQDFSMADLVAKALDDERIMQLL